MINAPRKRNFTLVYGISGLVICFIFIGIIGQAYLNWRISHAIDQNNQKFCKVLTLITKPGPGVPSPTPGTRQYAIAQNLNQLAKDYKCK